MVTLTYDGFILCMFHLALITVLWGIYQEIRRIAQAMSKKD